jgi:hypothetical protein
MIPNFPFERLTLAYKILYYLGSTLDMDSGSSNCDSSSYFSVRLGKFLDNILNKPPCLLMELSNCRPEIAQGFQKVGGSKIQDMVV